LGVAGMGFFCPHNFSHLGLRVGTNGVLSKA
jgi:hypothetical protein